jgi:hypothetical protein
LTSQINGKGVDAGLSGKSTRDVSSAFIDLITETYHKLKYIFSNVLPSEVARNGANRVTMCPHIQANKIEAPYRGIGELGLIANVNTRMKTIEDDIR